MDTLPLAVASLVAQTHQDWELVLVDDGSQQSPRPFLDSLGDKRIRCFTFPENRGRGAARQRALDESRGQYLAMLDSDDWYYPDKLERQVAALDTHQVVTVVSGGLAIVDDSNHLSGIRDFPLGAREGQTYGPCRGLSMPPFEYAPSLIRMKNAQAIRFNASFRLGQDTDFMLRLMREQRYLVLPSARYAYTELTSMSLGKILKGLGFNSRIFRQHWREHPLTVGKRLVRNRILGCGYRLAYGVGWGNWIITRRSQIPQAHDYHAFYGARSEVLSALRDFRTATPT